MRGLLNSFSAYGQAISLVGKLRLWKYFLLPGVISLLFALVIGLVAWGFSDNLGEWIASWITIVDGEGWWISIRNKMAAGFHHISSFLGGLIILLIGLILYKNILIALIGPFMSPLSERVEAHLTGLPVQSTGMWSGFSRGLRLGIRNTIREVLWMLPLLLLGLIPVLSLFCTVAIFLIQAYYAGFGNFDFVLERHRSAKDSIQYVKNHRGMVIGNGIPFLLMIGFVVGIFFAPTISTIAATISYHNSNNYQYTL